MVHRDGRGVKRIVKTWATCGGAKTEPPRGSGAACVSGTPGRGKGRPNEHTAAKMAELAGGVNWTVA